MPEPESPDQNAQDRPDQNRPDPKRSDQDATDPVSTKRDSLPGVDQGTPEERRLDALAPVDTERLESSQQAIDEAKQAAEPVLRHQRDEVEAEPEPAVTPDADIDESIEESTAVRGREVGERNSGG
jgi:hypothetical protein